METTVEYRDIKIERFGAIFEAIVSKRVTETPSWWESWWHGAPIRVTDTTHKYFRSGVAWFKTDDLLEEQSFPMWERLTDALHRYEAAKAYERNARDRGLEH